MTTSGYFSVRELLGLDPRDQLGECSRCGGDAPSLQLRVIGHQVALCRTCLHQLADLVDDDGRPPRLADYANSEDDEEPPDVEDDGPPDYGPPGSGAVITEYDW